MNIYNSLQVCLSASTKEPRQFSGSSGRCLAMERHYESDVDFYAHVNSRIESVFLNQLTFSGRICEVHSTPEGAKRPVGIWGWNTWCGIHDLAPLTDCSFHKILGATIDEGLSRPEPRTGLLPHAVPIDRDGRIGYLDGEPKVHYRTYGGVHGEDYCLDNIISWAKMALELFLYTRDRRWLTTEKLSVIEKSTDYILKHLTPMYNGHLIESGVEGDWTENTDWHADNSNNNVSMVNCLDLLVEVEEIFGRESKKREYLSTSETIRDEFRKDSDHAGFWIDGGWFLHGNDGTGQRIYGDRYFESTANYFSILWSIADHRQEKQIFEYINSHPEIESPYPVLTNHRPRNNARRMNYGRTVTDGDVWLTLGAHAAVARLRSGYNSRATQMYRSIVEYEEREGTIHNNIYQDGSANEVWSPEVANYGSLFTPLVEGVMGLKPVANGLIIDPRPLEGMTRFRTKSPLSFSGKKFTLSVRFGRKANAVGKIDGRVVWRGAKSFILPPDFEDGARITIDL